MRAAQNESDSEGSLDGTRTAKAPRSANVTRQRICRGGHVTARLFLMADTNSMGHNLLIVNRNIPLHVERGKSCLLPPSQLHVFVCTGTCALASTLLSKR